MPGSNEERDYPKLKTVDGEKYLDRILKVFYKDDVIPEKYDKHRDIYDIVVLDMERPKKES